MQEKLTHMDTSVKQIALNNTHSSRILMVKVMNNQIIMSFDSFWKFFF